MANGKSEQRKASPARRDGAGVPAGKTTMDKRQREALIQEADKQTQAIMRLEVYKRLSYSVVAVGALMIYTRVFQHATFWVLVLGAFCVVVGALAAIVLYVGVRNAKANVKRILKAAGVDPDAVRTKKDVKAEAAEKNKAAASDHAKGEGGGKPRSK